MAEILLSLTIIGVVAAITLPSLTGNINERTWNTQRKALYARMSQAIALMPALNGYGTLTEGNESTSAVDTAAETFVTEGLSKVLKINNICDSDHLADCGIPTQFNNIGGDVVSTWPQTFVALNGMFNGSYENYDGSSVNVIWTYSQTDTKVAAFETANGESVAAYYNPYCVGNFNETNEYYIQPKVCANFIYDLNGSKGPNTVGKDIGFMTVFYPTDSVVVAPHPSVRLATNQRVVQAEAGAACFALDNETRVPNIHEIASMFTNRLLMKSTITETGTNGIWSGSKYSASYDWLFNWACGKCMLKDHAWTGNVWCINR